MLTDASLSLAAGFGMPFQPFSGAEPLQDDAELRFAGFSEPVRVLPCPGHTPGGAAFRIGGDLFTGDTLFRHGCGRTDFPGGSAQTLAESLRRLLTLPEGTLVHPGHGESTTVALERSFFMA